MNNAGLKIENYPLHCKIGCLPQEHIAGQEVLISIDLTYLNPIREENLADTVDYGILFQKLTQKFTNQSFQLLETLVRKITIFISEEFKNINELTVSVEKTVIPYNLNKGAKVKAIYSMRPS